MHLPLLLPQQPRLCGVEGNREVNKRVLHLSSSSIQVGIRPLEQIDEDVVHANERLGGNCRGGHECTDQLPVV